MSDDRLLAMFVPVMF